MKNYGATIFSWLAVAAIAAVAPLAASCSTCGGEPAGKPDAAPTGQAALPKDSGIPPDTIVADAEREAYVKAYLTVSGLDVGPDMKPSDDGGVVAIGGLMKAAGLVKNTGDKAVKNASITIHLLDANDKVIGTYFHDVLGNKRLAPGEERSFKFELPQKKEYSGKFSHSLR